jgi:lipopolysaccharide/colanic/teichoic acid biosynthesis glycosyltransferase
MYDLKYLTQWSLGADFLLLCRTVACVFRGSGL